MSLIFGEKQKKKTFWKFNNSLLSNPDYVNKVKETILNTKKQYAATPYNIDNISSIDNEIFQSVLNDQLFFDILLLEIRNTTLSFSSNLNKLTNQEEKKLIDEIKKLEDTVTDENCDILNDKKNSTARN